MLIHRVEQGDCIASIAFRYGFFPDTIWQHPDNSELREKRQNPNVLLPGDSVVIPDKRPRSEDGVTAKRHRFRRKGVPEKLRIQLLSFDEPRRSTPYVIEVDGDSIQGITDDEGRIEQWIAPDARQVQLRVDGEEAYDLELGHLDPETEQEGIAARLANLGYLDQEQAGAIDGAASPAGAEVDLGPALEAFQFDNDLELTGELDDETLEKLIEAHGS